MLPYGEEDKFVMEIHNFTDIEHRELSGATSARAEVFEDERLNTR